MSSRRGERRGERRGSGASTRGAGRRDGARADARAAERQETARVVRAPQPAWRLTLVKGAFGCVAMALVVHLLGLTTIDRGRLLNEGERRWIGEVELAATRGTVRDRRGEPLAVSTPVFAVWIDPQHFSASEAALTALAERLEEPVDALRSRLEARADRRFVYLKRRVLPEDAKRVEALRLAGLYVEKEYRRFYPAGEVAAHVLGLTDIDEQGIEGLEYGFDEWLSGQPGRVRVLKNRLGETVRELDVVQAARAGRNLALTLDMRLQYLAYRHLKRAMDAHGARSGTVVLVDPRSGEVLALVNQPSFNPNGPVGGDYARMRNRAVTDLYEPGSTMKPFAVAAALASGAVEPGHTIDTSPGWLVVDGKRIEDPRDRGVLDLRGVLAQSSQVGITRLVLGLPEDLLLATYPRLGFGAPTMAGFPGERAGHVPMEIVADIERATLAYGYGLSVTPLQLAQAYAVLANGGRLVPLSIIRGAETPPAHRVLPEHVADTVLDMLTSVVSEDGTAPLAAVEGVTVAGKTGTARKLGEVGYDDTRHLALFAGIAPVPRPRLVGVVVIDEPGGRLTGGGNVAAPVFSAVAEEALRLLAPETVALRDEDEGARRREASG